MKHNKKNEKETQEDFFETKIDQTPYQSFWAVLASSILIIMTIIFILWNLAGLLKREIRIHLPGIDNFSIPKIDFPKIPDKITLPNLNNMVEDQSKTIQKNIQNGIENEINEKIQNQKDNLKP